MPCPTCQDTHEVTHEDSRGGLVIETCKCLPDPHICRQHTPPLTVRGDCPLCAANARIEELEAHVQRLLRELRNWRTLQRTRFQQITDGESAAPPFASRILAAHRSDPDHVPDKPDSEEATCTICQLPIWKRNGLWSAMQP
jgi:hypothetical protein